MSRITCRQSASRGMNSAPTAYSPGLGKLKPRRSAFLAKNLCGICTRIPAPAAVLDPCCRQSRALARSARPGHLVSLRDVVARPSSSSPLAPAQTPRKRLLLGASLASATPIGVTAPRAPLVIGGLLATALRLTRVWPLVLGSPAMPDGSAYHRPMRAG